MSFIFDATLKDLLRITAADLTPVLHFPMHLPARTLNVDLSTLTAATDVAFGFGDPLQEIADVNLQAGPDRDIDARMLLYAAALFHRYHVPVRTILVMLRPVADHSRLQGTLSYCIGGSQLEFKHEIVRMWQQPLAPFLQGGVGLLPLAPLCKMPDDVPLQQALREVIQQIDQRLAAELPYADAVKLMTAAFILTGMRAERQTLPKLFRGVKVMHESTAFDYYEDLGEQRGLAIGLAKGRDEGRVEASQRLLLRLGKHRFGSPPETVEAAIRSLQDIERLERMTDAFLSAQSWDELLATP